MGRLAGGIAHDFNNMLTVITSYTDMVLTAPDIDPVIAADLSEVAAAADRAARLTRQLLTFTRKRLSEYQAIDLASVISGISGLLRPLTGERITLEYNFSEPMPPIFGDARQLERAIINLVCNARDAMPAGGTIDMSIARLDVAADGATPNLPKGDFVLLKVRDTGCGMEPETVAKIFEPFFTTKAVGSGTGLGLATVYGIVRQSGGHVWCESEVGKGTTLYLAFPAQPGVLAGGESAHAPVSVPKAALERILLVEDEAAVRAVTARVLVAGGYSVLSAGTAAEALDILKQTEGAVDLVITDLVMPQMNGPEFAAAVCRAYPHVRIVYISGYSSEDTWQQALSERHDGFLEKPFSSAQLLTTVRAALEGGSDRR